jgi:hypothetical protein
MRHTPGPWRIHRLTNGWPVITSDGHDIADLRLNGKGLPHVEANAALIAAAPKLLESLERAEFLMRRVADGDHQALSNLRDASNQARAAIVKATTIENQPTRE